MTEGDPATPFTRDDAREVPHNLFTNTSKLWAAGKKRAKGEPVPQAVFTLRRRGPEAQQEGASASRSSSRLGDGRMALGGRRVGPLPER